MELLLLAVLFLVLAAEFVNGWTDAPNAVATVISTGVASPKIAVPAAVVLNALGTTAGTAVAATIGKGIVETSAVSLASIAAAMISVILWGIFAAYRGIPVSKSHALIAGISGAAIAGGGFGALMWSGWKLVFIGMLGSIAFGFLGAYVIGKIIIFCAERASPTRAKRLFDGLQLLSASFMAFNHGLNDGQKFIGVFVLVLMLGGVLEAFEIPLWVILLCAVTMGLGTSLGGWKIIRTVGKKMVHIKSWQGFAAETAASTTIFIASAFGVPLSTTHTITSSIAGASSSRRIQDVRWGVLGHIIQAWVFTFPICGALAWGAATLANLFI